MIFTRIVQISISLFSIFMAAVLFKHYYQTYPEGFETQYFRLNALIAISVVMVIAPGFIDDNRRIYFAIQAIGVISLATFGYFAFIYQ